MKLVVDNLAAMRGGELIFENLSFSLEKGKAFLITGHNGVGKSTLLRVVCGLLPALRGTIKLTGLQLKSDDRNLSDFCHYLGDKNAMKPAMSVAENLIFWQQFMDQSGDNFVHGNTNNIKVSRALDMLGLEALKHVPFAHLSTGQRRRAAMAKLLVCFRPFWLLDEPTCGLDAKWEGQWLHIMQTHLDEGGMILAATHLPLSLNRSRSLRLERLGFS